MQGLDFWRFSEELTVVQAALLFTGHDPAKHPTIESRSSGRPDGYEAIKHSILTAIKKDTLEGRIIHDMARNFEDAEVCPYLSTVNVESLKNWLNEKGVRKHIFFFPMDTEEEFLSENHTRYAPKLAAAVKAWKAMENETLYKTKSPKQAMQVWLRKNAPAFGLSDDEGKPAETVIEDIAKIANWRPKGGAPSTPVEEVADNEQRQKRSIEVNNPSKIMDSHYPSDPNIDDIDDLIPF